MTDIRITTSEPAVIATPATFTVRPLSEEEARQAAGGILIGLLLPAVQKIR